MGADGLIVRGLRDCLVTELPFDVALCGRDELVGGIDPGYQDPCVIWSGVYRDGTLWLIDYYRRVKGLAKDHVNGLLSGHTYYCDPPELDARMHLQDEAQKRGLDCRFLCAPRKRNAGEDTASAELRLLIDMVNAGRVRILMQLAPQLICEADTFSWNEKTGKPQDGRSETWGHFDSIYALKYLAMGVYQRDRVLFPLRLAERDDGDYMNRRNELLACA